MNYQDNPAYQRMVQKRMAMTPDQAALFDVSDIDAQFSAAQMQREMSDLNMGANKRFNARTAGMAETQLRQDKGNIKFMRGEERMGENIAMAGIGVSGAFGIADYLNQSDKAKKLQARAALMRSSGGYGASGNGQNTGYGGST